MLTLFHLFFLMKKKTLSELTCSEDSFLSSIYGVDLNSVRYGNMSYWICYFSCIWLAENTRYWTMLNWQLRGCKLQNSAEKYLKLLTTISHRNGYLLQLEMYILWTLKSILLTGIRSYITIIKKLSGNERSSKPLNFFIIVIHDLWPTYSFLQSILIAHLEMVALTTSQIY